MPNRTITTLSACLLGAAVLAGCASPTSSTQTASAGVMRGKIVAVEPASAAGTTTSMSGTTSSGATSSGTTMAGGNEAVVVVGFADGTQSRYSVTQNQTTFQAGDTVNVIRDGQNAVISKQPGR